MDAVTNVPSPHNEPVRQYPPGSPDRAALESRIKEVAGERAELTMTIGGRERMAGGEPVDVVAPHNHRHVLGTMRNATAEDVTAAIEAAARARDVPVTFTPIDHEGAARLYARKLVLVRPDGHVAWRGDQEPADPGAVVDHIRGAGGATAPRTAP